MRINKIELNNFKRFTNLTIENIPSTAKLVLLIGANGSGKSSVFDAFHNFKVRQSNASYYLKSNDKSGGSVHITFDNGTKISEDYHSGGGIFHPEEEINFIGRSSIRIVPRISRSADTDKIMTDADRPNTFIDADERFSNDVFAYMQIIDNTLRGSFFERRKTDDSEKIFQDFIQPFNDSLANIFGSSPSTTIKIVNYQNATPFADPQLIFRKGQSDITYDLLSHGEKQVVVLLLNFIIRKEQHKNAIIYIDELDCHLNTTLQTRLLKEIVTNWIPDTSQLWTASHSLGFIDYARKSETAVIVDFDNLDFDVQQIIEPQLKDNLEVYEIAIPKDIISSILSDKKLVVSENTNSKWYNLALGARSYLFLPAQNNREVFLTVKGDDSKMGLRDRDYLRNDEIETIKTKFPNLKILDYYSFENYLFHPDNLAELLGKNFDRDSYIRDIIEQKNKRFNTIISKIAVARQSYIEFKEGIKNDENVEVFIQQLGSNDFETFYPFFNVKDYFDRGILSRLNLHTDALVKTNWFKTRIEQVLIG